MNKINLKYLLYLTAASISLYLFINMLMLVKSSKIQAFSIVRPMEIKQVSTNQISDTPPASFNYELAAVRLGDINTSVIVKKGGKEYVVQINELLENKYKLVKLSNDIIIFEFQGKEFTIINRFKND